MTTTLAIGDIHEPVSHPGYLAFCQDMAAKWQATRIIFMGDVVDWHAISFHAHHPDCPGPADEYEAANLKIAKWYKAFQRAKVCIGNHDERVIRLAESVNIPSRFIRDYREVWETPRWTWDWEFVEDDVYYFHGTGNGGLHPAFNAMKKRLMSVVMGHCHSVAGTRWLANPSRRIFSLDVGCGVDCHAWQFAYGRHNIQKPILGVGIVRDGTPYHEIMPCGRGEKYHRSRFPDKE